MVQKSIGDVSITVSISGRVMDRELRNVVREVIDCLDTPQVISVEEPRSDDGMRWPDSNGKTMPSPQ